MGILLRESGEANIGSFLPGVETSRRIGSMDLSGNLNDTRAVDSSI